MTHNVLPLRVLRARADARAMLWRDCLLTWEEAVEPLYAAADRDGLIEQFGQQEIAAIINAAFDAARRDGDGM